MDLTFHSNPWCIHIYFFSSLSDFSEFIQLQWYVDMQMNYIHIVIFVKIKLIEFNHKVVGANKMSCITLYVLSFLKHLWIYITFMKIFFPHISQVDVIQARKETISIYYIVNNMTDDDLATWGSRASLDMILTQDTQYIPCPDTK